MQSFFYLKPQGHQIWLTIILISAGFCWHSVFCSI